ncbi:MAG TPA: DUF4442 domain-containing protein [Saprospiraceae bacterium]|nr:DUF4442 domain-containing protein [Saprospiraceae bacterium]
MAFDRSIAKKLSTPWKLRLWMAKSLPMGLISGMSIQSLDEQACVVVLKERWWIRNPFGSVFWAVMGMAAELSTGALVFAHARERNVKFILVGVEGEFFKKVKGKSYYFCETGLDVLRSIEQIISPNDTSDVILPVTAKDEAGQVVAEFRFRWQLKKPMN